MVKEKALARQVLLAISRGNPRASIQSSMKHICKQLNRRIILATAIGLLGAVTQSQAVPTIGFDTDGDLVLDAIVPDQGAAVQTAGEPVIPFVIAEDTSDVLGDVAVLVNGGVFVINSGTTKPQLGSAAAPSLTIDVDATGVPAGTYYLYFSEVDFGPSSQSFFADLTFNPAPGSSGTTVTYETFISNSNTLFDISGPSAFEITEQFAATATVGAAVTSGIAPNTGFPYSLTQRLTVTVGAGSPGSFTATGNLAGQAVPDGGATLALLGFAMVGMEGIRRRLSALSF